MEKKKKIIGYVGKFCPDSGAGKYHFQSIITVYEGQENSKIIDDERRGYTDIFDDPKDAKNYVRYLRVRHLKEVLFKRSNEYKVNLNTYDERLHRTLMGEYEKSVKYVDDIISKKPSIIV